MADTKKYRFVGQHADSLDSGRPIGPGEFVDLTDEEIEQPHAAGLIQVGLLVEASGETEDTGGKSRQVRSKAKEE
jgi:hypothetical protein